MARTNYALTADSANTAYADDNTWPQAGGTSSTRYSRIGALGQTYAYPSSNDDGFNIPTMRFLFLDAYAKKVPSSPIIQVKMPSVFNITSFSDYARTENVFGGGDPSDIDFFSDLAKLAGAEKYKDTATTAANAVVNAADAFQYAVRKGLANVLGFAESAGLNNISQYEFSRRQAINPMSQLLYKGPQYRRYQLPMTFKPKNSTDASNVKKIISLFRVASSPSVPSTSGLSNDIAIGEGQTFTYGYPHLTQFSAFVLRQKSSESSATAKRIFRSLPCIIESVGVDYGGEKMTFFNDGKPTDVTLTLQLTEIMPRTLGDSITDGKEDSIEML